MNKTRCHWCSDNLIYMAYHDNEWGVPVYEEQMLFELLILEGMQSGLSWLTILQKREAIRRAFNGFDPKKISGFSTYKVQSLLKNTKIIRNKRKIESVITNAKAFLEIANKCSFSDFLWKFVDGKPIQNHWKTSNQVPTYTIKSTIMANELKQKGFKFVGPTICYAFMQATGMVNDHLTSCFRHKIIMNY